MQRVCLFGCRFFVVLAAFLALSIMIPCSGLSPALAASDSTTPTTFVDCPSTSPVYPYVEYLYDKGLVDGYGDGTIRPGNTITRAEAAALLCRALSPETYAPAEPTYSDVSPQHWAYAYIESTVHNGLFEGYGDGTFQPEALLTRAQLAALMMRIHGEAYPAAVDTQAFHDVSTDNWAYPVLTQAVEAGIMQTVQPYQIKPDSPGSRSDAFRSLAIATILDPDRSRVPLQGQVVPLQGSTYLMKNGTSQLLSGPTGCSVGDTIKTDPSSAAEIVFPDGSSFKLAAGTLLSITKSQGQIYIQADGSPGILVDELKFKLDQGQIFGVLSYSYFKGQPISAASMAFDSMPSAIRGLQDAEGNEIPWWKVAFMQKERLTVDMPWSVAGVRGTIFSALVNDHENTATVVDGTVWFTGNGTTVRLTTPLNYSTVTAAGQNPSLPQAMPEIWRQMWRDNLAWLQTALERITEQAPYPDSAPAFDGLSRGSSAGPSDPSPAGTPSMIQQVIENTILSVENEIGFRPTGIPVAAATSGGGGGGSHHSPVPQAPAITAVTAADLGYAAGINNGDTLTVAFNVNTNEPQAATKTDIDNLLDFGGKMLGADYTGQWVDARTLVVTVVDAAGATFAIGDSVTIKSGGALKTADGRSAASISSQGCEGSFGIVVTIPDVQLENSLRDALGKPVGDITDTDLAGLTSFESIDGTISDLTGLEYAVNLQSLILWGNLIDGLSPLYSLENLQTLDLSWNQIMDITPLSSLVNLVDLNLSNNRVEDLRPLSGLENLHNLNLGSNSIYDITSLEDNPGLGSGDSVDLSHNILDTRAGSDVMNQIQSLIDRGINLTWAPSDLVAWPPEIMSITAENNGGNYGLGDGDTLTLVFDAYTNTPVVSTTDNVDTLISFGTASFGAAYSGVWTDQKTLVLTVADATGATLRVGDTIQVQTGGNLRTADGVTEASVSSGSIDGSFGSIYIPDAALEGVIRNVLSLPVGDITPTDMEEGLPELGAGSAGIQDITGLEYAVNLGFLSLENNQVSDLGPLSGLKYLSRIYLSGNQITDITPLVDNTDLGSGDILDISNNNLDTTSGSPTMIQIQELIDRGVSVTY